MTKILRISFFQTPPSSSGNKTGVILGGVFGLLLGVGFFTFNYAEGFSYLSSDPKACVNCHIMRPEYDSWQKGSHHAEAKCVDCHLPHDLVGKYVAKGLNGYHHSKGFTFQDFHEPIMIKTRNSRILQDNCLRCHEEMVHDLVAGARDGANPVYCVHCHQSIGHGEPAGMGRSDLGELTVPSPKGKIQ